MIRHAKLIEIGGTKLNLVLEADQVTQHRRLATLRDWIKLELRLATGLLGSQILELSCILEKLGEAMRGRLPLLGGLIDGAYESTYLLEAAQSTLTDGPVAVLRAISWFR